MFTVVLRCANDHKFEGWYDTAQDFLVRVASCDLSCPMCGTFDIGKDKGPIQRRSESYDRAIRRLLHRIKNPDGLDVN